MSTMQGTQDDTSTNGRDDVKGSQDGATRNGRAEAANDSKTAGVNHKRKKKGRNLVVCIDGTGNSFGKQNTNVLELYGKLKRNEEQLTFYRNGIGTEVSESHFALYSIYLVLRSALEMAFAWNVDQTPKQAYRWLVNNYRPGDRIYLFGFSRGAYQARVLSGMLGLVGLLRPTDELHIPRAYSLYMSVTSDESFDLPNSTLARPPSTRNLARLSVLVLFLFASMLNSVFLKYHPTLKGLWLWVMTIACMTWMLALCILTSALLDDLSPAEDINSAEDDGKAEDVKLEAATNISPNDISEANDAGATKQNSRAKDSNVDPIKDAGAAKDANLVKNIENAELSDSKKMQLQEFCKTMQIQSVKVQFIGCWDTVSSIGPPWARQPYLSEPLNHVKHFRHALALDECRVGFLPTYVQPEAICQDKVKEVWFPGAHSDVGGAHDRKHRYAKNSAKPAALNPAFEWMVSEAKEAKLLLREAEAPQNHDDTVKTRKAGIKISNSLTLAWIFLELVPWRKRSFKSEDHRISWRMHAGAGRSIISGQRVHESALMKGYQPIARLPQEEPKSTRTPKKWGCKHDDKLPYSCTPLEREKREDGQTLTEYQLKQTKESLPFTKLEVCAREISQLATLSWLPVGMQGK